MPKKIKDCTIDYLTSIPLPVHAETYTVISHENVIDYSKTALVNAGFTVEREEYRSSHDGQIAQGIYRLHYGSDSELSMMFAWTNSYNKQVRFKCGIGAYINQNGTVMVCGDMGSWARKHTGTADTETIATIAEQVSNANMYYNQLVSDKNEMQNIILNKRKQSQLLGILFAEYKVLTTEQASIIRQQMEKPSHVFANTDSLWAFYNFVTLSLQQSHPKTWMEDQRILHYFISTANNFQQCSVPAQVIEDDITVNESTETLIDPNQIDLLDVIAEMEADLEADQIDEDERYAANEELSIADEDDVVHDLYGVDNDIEVSLPPAEIHDLFREYIEKKVENSINEKDAELSILECETESDNNFDLDFTESEENKKDEETSDFF